MSLFETTTIQCPACATTSDFEAAGSVNADRRPDLRDAILDNTFQNVTCPSCGEAMRLEPVLNYLDVELGLWLAAYPPRQIGDYLALEDQVQGLFDESYGAAASEAAQTVGASLRPRLTFGWPGTCEKLLLQQHGLDDVAIELLKLDLLRRLPEAPLRPGVELRVERVSEAGFDFIWIETASEDILQRFQAKRALLSEIEANPDGWAPLRSSLTQGLFVDMQKLYLGAGRDAA
ncbi:CpXC domain containing protein [Sulfitobacter noctilucae]|uniref:CpXC domain-containing protein n=1 Tax=Sulfitobacter noctilucae TaxID=1342302 RepID=UPI00046A655E|nr:CpXC domain-containing protein [Sulfitobacter noctilucae]KIN70286.1 CpXC domain containing protein [Sulfitobacter noctilucae]